MSNDMQCIIAALIDNLTWFVIDLLWFRCSDLLVTFYILTPNYTVTTTHVRNYRQNIYNHSLFQTMNIFFKNTSMKNTLKVFENLFFM